MKPPSLDKPIPLRLQGGPNVSGSCWPITQGIPFAEGQLPSGTAVTVVDAAGNGRPTQAECLSAWNADGQYVRWLLVDFQTGASDRQAPLFLQVGSEADPPAPPCPVTVEQDGRTVRVDTGRLRMTFTTRPARLPGSAITSQCELKTDDGWQETWADADWPLCSMVDQHGQRYDSSSAEPPRISIEQAGPLRACLAIRGHHASPAGVRFCPYILRLHFFAGLADIRIQHTFIFDQDPHRIELSQVGLTLPGPGGRVQSLTVGGEGAPYSTTDAAALQLLQHDDERFEIVQDGESIQTGRRSNGMAMLTSKKGSTLAVLKEFWQEYPAGMEVDENGIDVQVWPARSARNLTFTSPFEEEPILFNRTRDEDEVRRLLAERPTAPLHLKSFGADSREDFLWIERVTEKLAPDRVATHCDTGTDHGEGAAKTSDIWLRLSPEAIPPQEAADFAAAVQQPMIAPAEPAHTAASRAMGQLHHAEDERFSAMNEGLDWMLQAVAVEPREKGRLYGKMRYGNMVCSHATGPGYAWMEYKDTEPTRAFRWVDASYNNEANDQTMAVWAHFLRTGRAEHFRVARAYTRYLADVGFIHARRDDPDSVGLMHYHNAHRWSGGGSPSHTLLSGILCDYYLTGDRRQMEVALELGEWIVSHQEKAGILSCRHGTLHREFTGPLWSLLELYQATWDERFGQLAHRSLNWMLQAFGEPPEYPVSIYTRGLRGDEALVEPAVWPTGNARELYYLYSIAWRLFPSERLSKRILAEADFYLWEGMVDNYLTADQARRQLGERSRLWAVDEKFYWTDWASNMPDYETGVVCLAWEITADPLYAAYARYRVEQTWPRQVQRCRHDADFRFTWLWFGNYIPRLACIVAEAMDRDPDALAAAERTWKQKRAEMGNDVYEGPGIDHQVDTMDALGVITSRPPADLPRQGPTRRYEPKRNLGPLPVDDPQSV